MTSEKPVGVWCWIFLITFNIVFVCVADYLLHRNHFEFMTTEFREGLSNEIFGPILVMLWFGSFIGMTWHFFTHRGK